MAQMTPPKGRPTVGRRDRQVAKRTSRSRSFTKKFVWAALAVAVLVAVLVLGTGSGSPTNAPAAGAMVPFFLSPSAFSRIVAVGSLRVASLG